MTHQDNEYNEIEEKLGGECHCHQHPPCHWCMLLTVADVAIQDAYGRERLRDYWRARLIEIDCATPSDQYAGVDKPAAVSAPEPAKEPLPIHRAMRRQNGVPGMRPWEVTWLEK
jgi:hypothetical protein